MALFCAPNSNHLIGGLVVIAAMICALPVAKGLGAATKDIPNVQVNRAAKGDRFVEPQTIARKNPAQMQREPVASRGPLAPQEPAARRQIMDGCEPMFSPVTVPSMAHLAGRCVG
jgi:hypothetical protein